MQKKISLAEKHPELSQQFHPIKNGSLVASESIRVMEKIWWKCPEGDDHEWKASISARTNNKTGCPYCSGNLPSKNYNLKVLHPELIDEWDFEKNIGMSPENFRPKSSTKVWWICNKADDHRWKASISSRVNGTGCPMCSNRIVVKSNCLSTTHPELKEQWDNIRNGDLSPNDITISYRKKIWWKCNVADDHIWDVSPKNRRQRDGTISNCPFCSSARVCYSNSIATTHPHLIDEWHPTKNGNLKPEMFVKSSEKKVWWKCREKGHEWEGRIKSRTKRKGLCPICVGQLVIPETSIATTHPEVAKQWSNKNKLKPTEVTFGSKKKYYWQCPENKDHIYLAALANKTGKKSGCPICRGLQVHDSNSLSTLFPEISKLWHPKLNKNLTPEQVTFGSGIKVWWKCPKGEDHEWMAPIANLTSGNQGCPVCAGKKVVLSNSLETLHPKIAKQWHPTKNKGLIPSGVTETSGRKIWWKCDKSNNHEWKATIASRTSGTNCPFCDLTPQSRQELIITFELLKFFKDINPKGYKTKLNGRLRAIDIFIPDLNLAIEFDGAYWHKDNRAIDKIKSEMLMEEGYQVIRIREEPLKKIHENDIISTKPYSGKDLTNKILKRILDLFSFSNSVERKIHNYISKDSLQNEKALDKYIDQILEEKAAKKK
jgi:hypothetical protein